MRLRRAIADLRLIETALHEYETAEDELPETLDELETRIPALDPWGHPYEYLVFRGPGWRGKARKDRFLVPINSTFDLYSIGPDAETRPPLQNRKSWDDVVRANDGAFYGLGRDF
jgi:general secretion pathway protein G